MVTVLLVGVFVIVPSWVKEPNWIEYATFGGLVVGAIVAGWGLLLAKWRSADPFNSQFSKQSYAFEASPRERRRYSRKESAGIGSTIKLFLVIPRRQVTFDPIDVRFVEKRWQLWPPLFEKGLDRRRKVLFEWADVPDEEVWVTQIRDRSLEEHWGHRGHTLDDRDNGKAGREATYNPPHTIGADGALWLQLKVLAKKPWKGHLSFRAIDPITGRFGYTRRRFVIHS